MGAALYLGEMKCLCSKLQMDKCDYSSVSMRLQSLWVILTNRKCIMIRDNDQIILTRAAQRRWRNIFITIEWVFSVYIIFVCVSITPIHSNLSLQHVLYMSAHCLPHLLDKVWQIGRTRDASTVQRSANSVNGRKWWHDKNVIEQSVLPADYEASHWEELTRCYSPPYGQNVQSLMF